MKVVLLAGGMGTRISEETGLRPKPMVEIGGKPILWHIMKIYSHYGYNEFVVCCGYKGYMIKEYFADYYLHNADLTVDLSDNSMQIHKSNAEAWKITLVDTGAETLTGGRIKRIQKYIGNEPFMLTYGDGVADIDINKLVKIHKESGRLATVTVVQPSGRFGAIQLDDKNNNVLSFKEKPKGDGSWINGGFFVLQPEVFDYIEGDNTTFEREPLENLATRNNLCAYRHYGFWRPMDTLRDKTDLEEAWQSGNAKWKIW
ncbi:MAG: glucose-1-phosphate cytidylyltransferase [Bacteroidales bacterium]|jgi:glucose-1-phosphate cytidylyltransferase|nr:glucose-1-phosphate cytidylyltransferase [Bacteroidales bacterium]